MAAEITAATRLVIVCNPNNPTSTALPFERIEAFVEQVPRHIALIIDEAYCEYSTLDDPDATLDLLDDHPNLVLLRTFSKVYGLAGLRVGFGLCGSEEFVGAVNQVRQPFFVQRRRPGGGRRGAASTATRSPSASSARWSPASSIEEGLAAMGMQVAESQANFVWFDLPARTPTRPDDRPRADERGMHRARGRRRSAAPGALRVTYGPPIGTTSASSTPSANCCRRRRRMTVLFRQPATPDVSRASRYFAWRFI